MKQILFHFKRLDAIYPPGTHNLGTLATARIELFIVLEYLSNNVKKKSITYPIFSLLNGSLYGSLHPQKQSFCKKWTYQWTRPKYLFCTLIAPSISFCVVIMLKRTPITYSVCLFLNGSLHESLNGSYPLYCKNQNPSSAPPGWTWLNFPLSLNMYQIMLKRTSITYSICLFLNGSLYGSLHSYKQSFSKNLNLHLESSKISSLNHYCTMDSWSGILRFEWIYFNATAPLITKFIT